MFECKDLLALPSMAQARIIAGKSGLSNSIRWVYKPENMNFAKWVKGQELLIISTPVITSEGFNLKLVIEKAKKLNLAGALLLVGDKYIGSIDGDVISYANLNDFPIFVISGDIPLIDIFEEIGHAIAYNKDYDGLSDDILSGIIFGKNINADAYAMKFMETGYDINGSNRMFTINIHADNRIENFDYNSIMNKVRDIFATNNITNLMSRYGNNIVGCFKTDAGAGTFANISKGKSDIPNSKSDVSDNKSDVSDKKTEVSDNKSDILDSKSDVSGIKSCYKAVLENIYKSLNEYLNNTYAGISVVIGVGRAYNGIGQLQLSFTEASRCVILADKMHLSGRVFYYEEMGIYNLFLELGDKKMIQDYIDSTLGIIIEYDKANNSNLLETLKAYLWNNNSFVHASEQLYTHRNTVKYRIQRITEITGRDFDDAMTRLEYMNAIICLEVR